MDDSLEDLRGVKPSSAAAIGGSAAAALKFDIDDAYAEKLMGFMAPFGDSCKFLDGESDELPAVKYPQRSHEFPAAEDNPYNAWYVKTDIKGAATGPRLLY